MIDLQLFHSDILEHIFLKLDEKALKKLSNLRTLKSLNIFIIIYILILIMNLYIKKFSYRKHFIKYLIINLLLKKLFLKTQMISQIF